MPRAIRRIALLVAVAASIAAVTALAQGPSVNTINGIGLIDYTRKPDFKVGQWVRYHTTGSSLLGASDDYVSTLLIAGEERFWGEDDFWVETWTEQAKGKGATRAIATLMSYAIFGDSMPIPRMQLYMRKNITQIDENGLPQQDLLKRPATSLKTRKPIASDVSFSIDTLSADTVMTPVGNFDCQRFRIRQGTSAQQDRGDSTFYTEARETRTVYMTTGVPITHIAREDIDYTVHKRAWRLGRSQEGAPLHLIERAQGSSRIVETGLGLKGRMVPEAQQKSLAEQFPPTARTTTKSKAPTGGTKR